ncbi:hypothetical protein [Pediococcus cellicola]|uniref:hypothetical protein n=1 Tax=Pediococcus cellicola TaxID=319652 RepID=UPI00070B6A14|nr:hypothetical protein [Pediococcus cellicola]GEL16050.1 hypothetical protein PCE01_18520 [Pediococcus cellicola]
MLKKNKSGFVLSESLISLSIISMTLILVHNCVQNEHQVAQKLGESTDVSRTLLTASRRLDAIKSETISLNSGTLEVKKDGILLKSEHRKTLRKIDFE